MCGTRLERVLSKRSFPGRDYLGPIWIIYVRGRTLWKTHFHTENSIMALQSVVILKVEIPPLKFIDFVHCVKFSMNAMSEFPEATRQIAISPNSFNKETQFEKTRRYVTIRISNYEAKLGLSFSMQNRIYRYSIIERGSFDFDFKRIKTLILTFFYWNLITAMNFFRIWVSISL